MECVDTASLGIVERFGNFIGVLEPGLNCVAWPIDSVVGRVSGRVQQFACDCGTKTRDNVFVFVQVLYTANGIMLLALRFCHLLTFSLSTSAPPRLRRQVVIQYQVRP